MNYITASIVILSIASFVGLWAVSGSLLWAAKSLVVTAAVIGLFVLTYTLLTA